MMYWWLIYKCVSQIEDVNPWICKEQFIRIQYYLNLGKMQIFC